MQLLGSKGAKSEKANDFADVLDWHVSTVCVVKLGNLFGAVLKDKGTSQWQESLAFTDSRQLPVAKCSSNDLALLTRLKDATYKDSTERRHSAEERTSSLPSCKQLGTLATPTSIMSSFRTRARIYFSAALPVMVERVKA